MQQEEQTMKKVYSNPVLYVCTLESELMTLTVAGSAESDNLNFSWNDERSGI